MANIVLLIIAVLAVKLLWKIYSPGLKGLFGEKLVGRSLAGLPESHKVINDLMLRTDRGTTQVDHTVISPQGIFVIETKTYDGWIFGSERDRYWTQVLHRKKIGFYNPLHQNYGHVQALRTTLARFNDIDYYSIVVFNGGCELKKVPPGAMYRNNLIDFILSRKSGRVISGGDVDRIYSTLLQANILDRTTKREHRESVRARKAV
jgi:hypothetical protein